MEKDLCLDVALRLGKIIEQRLPGADVSNAFGRHVVLWKRTKHREPGQGPTCLFRFMRIQQGPRGARHRGTTEPEGLGGSDEVAARENPTAQGGVHELRICDENRETGKIDDPRTCRGLQDRSPKRIQKSTSR